MKTLPDALRDRAKRLGLYGLVAHWDELGHQGWVGKLLEVEEAERQRRSLERRIQYAHIGRFKPMVDFDWNWPKKIDRQLIEELFTFQFIDQATNAILIGPNGVGKSMIAQNLAHQALLKGYTVRFTTASDLLNELASVETTSILRRRIASYCKPRLLVCDEVGYLSYDNRHADLLFEIVTRRYQDKSILVTTNKPFSEWNQVFPNAACVVTLIDRLVHHAEIVEIQADSYRLKEARERAARRNTNPPQDKKARKPSPSRPPAPTTTRR